MVTESRGPGFKSPLSHCKTGVMPALEGTAVLTLAQLGGHSGNGLCAVRRQPLLLTT